MSRQATAYQLREAGYSWAQVAKAMHLSIGAVRVMVGREQAKRDLQREAGR